MEPFALLSIKKWFRLLAVPLVLAISVLPGLAQDYQANNYSDGGKKLKLPDKILPNVTIRDGVVFSSQASGLSIRMQLNIPILRCVTSRAPGESFPGLLGGLSYLEQAVSDGLVSKTSRVTLYIYVERLPGSPEGQVRLSGLSFNDPIRSNVEVATLNGKEVTTYDAPLMTGTLAEGGLPAKWNILQFAWDSKKVKFGSPQFTYDNHVDELFRLVHDKKSIAPAPGKNTIWLKTKCSVPGAMGVMNLRVHLYGMIEFGAMAPIIFVHGTNASHTTWEEPDTTSEKQSTLKDGSGFARALDNSPTVNPKGNPQTDLRGQYAGPWFYKIDLGPAGLYDGPEIKDSIVRKGKDRYIEQLPDYKNDSSGNASFEFSAMQLRFLIPHVLEAYGMNVGEGVGANCHLIAHSKGGSDCRWLVTKELRKSSTQKEKQVGDTTFKVLGFVSLGTPFQGTPVSDVGYTIRQLGGGGVSAVDAGQGVSPLVRKNIEDAADTVSLILGYTPSKIPKGAALRDQRYQVEMGTTGWASRHISYDDWQPFIKNGGLNYSVAGDADMDGDKDISLEEWKVLGPTGWYLKPLTHSGMTSTYGLLATTGDNLRLETIRGPDAIDEQGNHRAQSRIVIRGGSLTQWMPNDLVTPYSSALPRELENTPMQNRVIFRRAFLEYFKARRDSRGGNPPNVDAGNHSMLKALPVTIGILNLLKDKYPPTYGGSK